MHKLAAAVLLFLSPAALAQQQQEPRVTETIEVSIVNVDVIVTDREGNRVKGLTAADFEIREGGKVQPITNFAEYTSDITSTGASVEAGPAPATAPARPLRQPRTVVIFVEAARLLPPQASQLYDGLRKLLRETIASGDRAQIVSWRDSANVRQPFTNDLAALERTLAELEVEAINGPRDLARVDREEQAFADSVGTPGPPVHSLTAAKRQLYQIKQKGKALEALIQSIAPLEGRKIVVVALRRFGKYAGLEFFTSGLAPEYRLELETVEIQNALVRTANAHGVTLYPVYPTGLVWNPDDASVRRDEFDADGDLSRAAFENNIMINETSALDAIAEKTGGLFAWGAANIAEMLPKVADDLESYYSLGYRARSTGKDVQRDIVVKTKNPEYRVRSRRQYVEKSDETLMKDRVTANLYQKLEGSSFSFDVLFFPYKSAGRKKWTMPIKVRIPIAALTALPQGSQHAGEFSVYVVTGAGIGVTSDVIRRSQPFKIPRNDLERAKTSHFTYDFELQVDETVDRVSIGVVDETSKDFALKRFQLPPRPEK